MKTFEVDWNSIDDYNNISLYRSDKKLKFSKKNENTI